MRLSDALEQNKGIGPGFHFLRHALSIGIVLFHCRQLVYWRHSAMLLSAAGVTDPSAAAAAAQSGPWHFTLMDIGRPAFHALLGMFFGLSGFLIAGSAVRTATIRNFFTNRALRLFPALTVETMLSAVVLGPIFTVLPLKLYFTDPELLRYVGNIFGWVYFYLPGVFVDNPLPRLVNAQLWTLPLELYCYIGMLFCMRTGLIKQPRLFLAVGVLCLIAMLTLVLYDARSFNPKYPNFFAPWYIVVLFWLGVIFFLNADMVFLRLPFFIGCLVLYWGTLFFNVLTPLSGVFLIYCTVYIGYLRFPWWDRLVKADYSYGLFLYHCPILQAWIYVLAPHWKNVPMVMQLAMVIGLGVPTTLAFAMLSWRWVERPALSLRTVFAKTRSVTPADSIAVRAPAP